MTLSGTTEDKFVDEVFRLIATRKIDLVPNAQVITGIPYIIDVATSRIIDVVSRTSARKKIQREESWCTVDTTSPIATEERELSSSEVEIGPEDERQPLSVIRGLFTMLHSFHRHRDAFRAHLTEAVSTEEFRNYITNEVDIAMHSVEVLWKWNVGDHWSNTYKMLSCVVYLQPVSYGCLIVCDITHTYNSQVIDQFLSSSGVQDLIEYRLTSMEWKELKDLVEVLKASATETMRSPSHH